MKMIFEYNWCDYLTPCPYKNCEIGSYDCSQCENFIEFEELDNSETNYDSNNYKRFFIIKKGVVNCKSSS